MAIRVTCPACGTVWRCRDGHLGKDLRCAECGSVFCAATPSQAEAQEPLDVEPVAESGGMAEVPAAGPAEPRDDEPLDVLPVDAPDVEDDRPAASGLPRPFVLGPGERILLRGGFSSLVGWIGISFVGIAVLMLLLIAWDFITQSRADWTGPVCGILCFLSWVPPALWPFCRSGTYWLTNRRLHWKPHLGKPVAVPLDELQGSRIRVRAWTSTLHVRGKRRLSLRHIHGADRLWGALHFFAKVGPLAPEQGRDGTKIPDVSRLPLGDTLALQAQGTEAAWWTAVWRAGLSFQPGIAILRPHYLAFLPSQEWINVLGRVAEEAFWVFLGALGALPQITVEAKVPFDVVIPELLRHCPDQFDAYIHKAVKHWGGLLWQPGQATVRGERIRFSAAGEGFW